jgi:hypothetical protein
MAAYRRRKDRDTWHFCANCTEYPKTPGTYVEQYSKPTTGELCNQCKAKRDNNNCQ